MLLLLSFSLHHLDPLQARAPHLRSRTDETSPTCSPPFQSKNTPWESMKIHFNNLRGQLTEQPGERGGEPTFRGMCEARSVATCSGNTRDTPRTGKVSFLAATKHCGETGRCKHQGSGHELETSTQQLIAKTTSTCAKSEPGMTDFLSGFQYVKTNNIQVTFKTYSQY